MKFLLLASFAFLCTASTVYRSKNISIGDDGNIVITSPNGKSIVISKEVGPNGQRNIDISINGPNFPTKRIQVTDENVEVENPQWSSIDGLNEEYRLKRGSTKGKTQSDILAKILTEYQGVVDQAQYEKLLNRVNKAVKKGEVSPQIYSFLEQLDQQQQQGTVEAQVQGQSYGLSGNIPIVKQLQQVPYGLVSQQQLPYGYLYTQQQVPYEYSQPQQQVLFTTVQTPNGGYFLRRQLLSTTPNVNPLLERTLPSNYIIDLLADQQLSGGYQTVPQQFSSRGVYNNAILRQLLESQQVPYGQTQVYSQVPGVQQQIEQAIEQLQQLQQEQQYEQLREIEQPSVQYSSRVPLSLQRLFGINQQPIVQQTTSGPLTLQQLLGLRGVQQLPQQQFQQYVGGQQFVRGVPLTQQQTLQQLLGGQQTVRSVPLTQQFVGGQQSLSGLPLTEQFVRGIPLTQQQTPQQFVGVGQQQPFVQGQFRGIPTSTQQLYGQSTGYRTAQPTVQSRTGSFFNAVPQVQAVY